MIYFQDVKVEVCRFENSCFNMKIDSCCRAVPQLWFLLWTLGEKFTENNGNYYISVTLQGWLQGGGSCTCSAGRAVDPPTATTAKASPAKPALAGRRRKGANLKEDDAGKK
jgi:hypothetical protein